MAGAMSRAKTDAPADHHFYADSTHSAEKGAQTLDSNICSNPILPFQNL